MIQAVLIILAAYLATVGLSFLVLGLVAARVTEYRIALCFDLCSLLCVALSLFAALGAI